MIKNYLKTAFRNLWKNKVYCGINILGLAIGLASFLVLLLYLNHELSYDKWDDDLKRVYKISERTDAEIEQATPAPLAAFLRDNTPQIEAATSIMPNGSFELLLSTGDKQIFQKNTVTADSSFFKVFPYHFVQGNAATALDKPNAVVISQEVAAKLFGQDNPIGRIIKIHNAFETEVTGVFRRPETPSHLEVQVVHRAPFEKSNQFWTNYSYRTYVKTKQVVPVNTLEQIVDRIYYDLHKKKGNETLAEFRQAGHQAGLFVDAVQDLHNFPKHGSSNITTVTALLLLAILLLLAGTINFSNLSIASSIRRAKEVGVRKVIGSSRKQLFIQFLGEIGLQCLLSLGIAFVILLFILPYFKREFNVELRFAFFQNDFSFAIQLFFSLLVVILLSGLYPALFLSRYNTAKVLKGDYSSGSKGTSFRNVLIVLQFTFSAFFVLAAIIVDRQTDFLQSRDKGFSGKQVMRIEATQATREEGFEKVRNILTGLAGVEQVSKATNVPGNPLVDTSTYAFNCEGKNYRLNSVKVSTGYFQTLDVDLLRGRSFNNSYADQHTRSAVLNESAVRKMNLKEPIGARIHFPNCDSIAVEVVGVVKDFHVSGYENTVLPVVYTIGNDACVFQSGGAILVKLSGQDLQTSIAAIEKAWKTIEPDFPIRYSFLDDNFQQLFVSYIRLERIINFFSLTAVTIAIMGLFALTAFFVSQRSKEIGIRKILGARTGDLGLLLGKGFFRLVCISVLIAMPLGWWAGQYWLQGFAYRISLDVGLFISASLILISIAALTIGIQVIKAAIANPVDSLREE